MSLDNLATGSSLYGGPLDLSSPGGSSGSSSSFNPLSVGALGAGALGVGALLAEGGTTLPAQYGELEQNAGQEFTTGEGLIGQGQTLVGQGTSALNMASTGTLTPEQAAQLQVYGTGLTNTARQEYASMGRNPDSDTSYIQTQADIDTRVNAMAQQEIQSTIQLGLGEVSGGNSLISSGAGLESASNQALIAAGQAQIALDGQYSQALTAVFSAVGTIAGAALKTCDRRAKEDISRIGTLFDGTPVYRFRYIGVPGWEIGVMAQDIEKFNPDAVVEINGVKHVDIKMATERAINRGRLYEAIGDNRFGNINGEDMG